ncbi:Pimeloyl-ACP methyl ester carboxylesterase [Actinopolymorpha cephalotaxi]|uniref:Pimeloyl-ACP methyl ester carboxylesterase n=1 Tax=Actinopolymorpha cephalotaxi TaxID=504797 RepID=A0A1I3BCJ3_9ACTN|nr:alpha/beta hydrolase [Actinopolymorpha cephalotaxi]NYH86768.1 pimeloyl-ACP methyl ester carboxylesterase [Actinopolymorpha cephalotaxi]SFH59816.1 Pimeloyl-ACP methyl ester carboxylesterase [Actinopolymorpha cephalotaxi]
MAEIHYRSKTVQGQELFFREAGPAGKPTVVLLHGFPTSSHMFRNLIPSLAGDYHVIAPDHLGFGHSSAPARDSFTYTFDALADLTLALLDELGVTSFAMYVQDYGAPIGWRLALARPESVTAIISQNGNAYDDGFVESFWEGVWAWAKEQNEETEAGVRVALSLEGIKWQYVTGVPDTSLLDPDAWFHDFHMVSRPGNDLIQLDLFANYASNLPVYPRLHEYFRSSQVPLLAVWGEGDEIFGPAGAEAFRKDLPDAEVHLLQGGHFLLESAGDEVASLIRNFLARI